MSNLSLLIWFCCLEVHIYEIIKFLVSHNKSVDYVWRGYSQFNWLVKSCASVDADFSPYLWNVSKMFCKYEIICHFKLLILSSFIFRYGFKLYVQNRKAHCQCQSNLSLIASVSHYSAKYNIFEIVLKLLHLTFAFPTKIYLDTKETYYCRVVSNCFIISIFFTWWNCNIGLWMNISAHCINIVQFHFSKVIFLFVCRMGNNRGMMLTRVL